VKSRTGEKWGWTAGWIGSFFWLILLSLVRLYQGRLLDASVGIALVALTVGLIIWLAPWRHPDTKYWILFSPLIGIFVLFVAVFLWLEGGFEAAGFSQPSLLLLWMLIIPFVTAGNRKWRDGES